MKKVFLLVTMLVFSGNSLFAQEIIRITDNSYSDALPVVAAQGNVWWWDYNIDNLMLYNGSVASPTYRISIEGGGHAWSNWAIYANKTRSALDKFTGTMVYSKSDGNDTEIYLFDGSNEIKITDNDYPDTSPSICNGYIAWVGVPNDGTDNEIFLYKPAATLVTLSDFTATPSSNKVKLNWKTESEIDNAGFNIWRAEGFKKINDSLIPSQGSTTEGADYSLLDSPLMNGKLYFYMLEDIDTTGSSTFHGPVKAVPRKVYGIGEKE